MTGCWVSGPSPRNTTPHPCMLKVPSTLLLTRRQSSRGAACPPAQGVPPLVGQQAQLLEQAAKGNKSCPHWHLEEMVNKSFSVSPCSMCIYQDKGPCLPTQMHLAYLTVG